MFNKFTPKLILPALFILGLLASACAPARNAVVPQSAPGGFSMPSAGGAAPEAPAEVEYDTAAGNPVLQSPSQQIERMVIKNASLSIAVDDPSASMDRISRLAEESGGYVVSANVSQRYISEGVTAPQATITIRVPAEKLQDALAQIKSETTLPVISENVSSQDVTGEYTDLDSQVRNLEAAEEQLQEILDRATKTEDVLNVFNQLTQIRSQIEVLKGQMKYYEQSAALSAVQVELVPTASQQPITIGTWQPQGVARDALQALVSTLKGLATAVIWLVIWVLPTLLLVIGLPILVIWGIIRLLRRRKKAPAPAAQ